MPKKRTPPVGSTLGDAEFMPAYANPIASNEYKPVPPMPMPQAKRKGLQKARGTAQEAASNAVDALTGKRERPIKRK